MGINIIDLDNPDFECKTCGARVHGKITATEIAKHKSCSGSNKPLKLSITNKNNMTRGTIHCINSDNTITYTDQFNGDMYLEGHGSYIIEKLEEVVTHGDFVEMAEDFNEDRFRYDNFQPKNSVEFSGDTIICETNHPIFDPTFADYTYWKNLSGKNIKFTDTDGKKLILEHGGIAVFNFACRYLKVY